MGAAPALPPDDLYSALTRHLVSLRQLLVIMIDAFSLERHGVFYKSDHAACV